MTNRPDISLARALAPEDLAPGQFVAVLDEFTLSYAHCSICEPHLGPPRPIRLRWLPDEEEQPMRIVSVCLPFVLAHTHDKKTRLLDTRRFQLALLTDVCGRAAFNAAKAIDDEKPRARKRSGKRKSKRK